MCILYMFFIIIILLLIFLVYEIIKKNIHIWFVPYIKQSLERKKIKNSTGPVNIVFCFVDHFEPRWNNASYDEEVARMDKWINEYPKLASKHRDYSGRFPQHTFFYPIEEYREEHLKKLSGLCKLGFGEVEIHLHHHNDTAEHLTQIIEDFKRKLSAHGLLTKDNLGNVRYAFIHGNWALDNSRRDGKWCGVNNELQVLKTTGCYADFTLPSAPSDTQTRKINSIYYAVDNPRKPKSHNTGVDAEVGKLPCGDLLIVQGPLAINWKNRKWGIFPHIENAAIDVSNPPTKERIDLWINQRIHVKNKPDWVFVKVHTHGCQENNFSVLLGRPVDDMFSYLERKYNDSVVYRLHYVTASGLYDIVQNIIEGRI